MKTALRLITASIIFVSATFSVNAAVSVDGLLNSQIDALPLGLTPVLITFNQRPTAADFTMLQSLGIRGGRYLNQLPIVLTSVNRVQFNALKTKPNIKSLYANRRFKL